MAETCFHPSIEGAQHGAKSLTAFLDYAKASGATGAQPSNYMLQDGAKFKSPAEIKQAFASRDMTFGRHFGPLPFLGAYHRLDGKPDRPAVSAARCRQEIRRRNREMERDLSSAPAGFGGGRWTSKSCPMFWGVAFGWEVATGYPWGFWKGGGL